jgi:hypothetical protein
MIFWISRAELPDANFKQIWTYQGLTAFISTENSLKSIGVDPSDHFSMSSKHTMLQINYWHMLETYWNVIPFWSSRRGFGNYEPRSGIGCEKREQTLFFDPPCDAWPAEWNGTSIPRNSSIDLNLRKMDFNYWVQFQPIVSTNTSKWNTSSAISKKVTPTRESLCKVELIDKRPWAADPEPRRTYCQWLQCEGSRAPFLRPRACLQSDWNTTQVVR